ncbi:MAG: hypothetical protein ACOCX3_00985 [Chloroflexota bacterium]
MSQGFLERFLVVARDVTQAERSLAMDTEGHIVQVDNIDPADLESESFKRFAIDNLKQAINSGETVIANNVITDIAEAPTTNTNFANLRFIVAFPVAEHGAIYLDRHISSGVISRRVVERLMRFLDHVLKNHLEDQDTAALRTLYDQL